MSWPGYVARRSPGTSVNTVFHPVGRPLESRAELTKTPRYGRGDVKSSPRHGAMSASYTTYTCEASGAMAGAEYNGRSPAKDTACGDVQDMPPLVEKITSVFSPLRTGASDQASTISSVAFAPVGAPLAIETLG